jgi:hypothetical protein
VYRCIKFIQNVLGGSTYGPFALPKLEVFHNNMIVLWECFIIT